MSAYEAILRTLHDAEQHKLVSPDGLANAVLRDATGLQDSAMISRALWRLEQDGLVKRDVRGRRCFAISLTRTGTTRAASLEPTAKASKPTKPSASDKPSAPPSKAKKASSTASNTTPKTSPEPAPVNATDTSDAASPLPAKTTGAKASSPTNQKAVAPLSKEADAILALLSSAPNNRITDVDGRMNSILRQRLSIDDPLTVTKALTVLDKAGLIHRVLHGKRCPLLELTDAGRARFNLEPISKPEPQAATPVTPAVPVIAKAISEPAVDVEFATAVANQLLTLVVSRANTDADTTREVASLRKELTRTVEACEEAEQRAATSSRELALLRAELQTWKDRADRLEKNLDAVMNGPDRSRAAYDRARDLSRLISSRPNT
jgi:DNA-binding MarR family transcriptional regulator